MALSNDIARITAAQSMYDTSSYNKSVKKEDAIGRVSAEVIAECPPGISILLPGELITEEHLPYLNDYETLDVVKGKTKVLSNQRQEHA